MLRFEDMLINTAGLLYATMRKDTLTLYFVAGEPLVVKGPQAVRFWYELDAIYPDTLVAEREFREKQAANGGRNPLADVVIQRGPIPIRPPQ